MSAADVFIRRLGKLGVRERAALKASAALPHEPDVAAHDAFTAAYWPIRNSHLPRDPCRVVAALYFWHPDNGDGGNLVHSLRRLDKTQTERLVTELLAASFAVLPEVLLKAVRQLAAAGIPIDWPQLLDDLREWNRGDSSVQDKWAESWLQPQGERHAD